VQLCATVPSGLYRESSPSSQLHTVSVARRFCDCSWQSSCILAFMSVCMLTWNCMCTHVGSLQQRFDLDCVACQRLCRAYIRDCAEAVGLHVRDCAQSM
jgi:hypothetical protein